MLEPIGSESGTPEDDFDECLLEPNESGWVDAGSNICRAQGVWYSYNDCNDSPLDCTLNHQPAPGRFVPTEGRGMCTSGTTAAPETDEEMEDKWGAGIALSLCEDEDSKVKQPLRQLDLPIHGVRFTLESNLPHIRVNFPTTQTERSAYTYTVAEDGVHTVYFDEARQGEWVDDDEKVPLDKGAIVSVQFQVPTVVGRSIDFQFCINNFTLLLDR